MFFLHQNISGCFWKHTWFVPRHDNWLGDKSGKLKLMKENGICDSFTVRSLRKSFNRFFIYLSRLIYCQLSSLALTLCFDTLQLLCFSAGFFDRTHSFWQQRGSWLFEPCPSTKRKYLLQWKLPVKAFSSSIGGRVNGCAHCYTSS